MLIDSLDKLEEVLDLIKRNLPINMQLELNDACRAGQYIQPLPFRFLIQ